MEKEPNVAQEKPDGNQERLLEKGNDEGSQESHKTAGKDGTKRVLPQTVTLPSLQNEKYCH